MKVQHSSDAERFRQRVRDFLDRELPEGWRGLGTLEGDDIDRFLVSWRARLHAERLLAPAWPVEVGGGGLGIAEQYVYYEELARAGVPPGGPNDGFGIQMLGNTLLRWGTEKQKRTLLPAVLSGEDVWCQGFSEPDAGSDLAGIRCSATRDGDEWVISGQKIWTSNAHRANRIFMLVRTDPSAERHRGITFLLVRLDQPGITIRPIRMLNGTSEFNEVFFDGARTPVDDVVGEVNGGWPVAMTLLGFERAEAAAALPIRFRREVDRLAELARSLGRLDAVVRERLAAAYTRVEILRYLGLRTLTALVNGRDLGPPGAITKLFWSEHHRCVTELATSVLGAHALAPTGRIPSSTFHTDDAGAPNSSMSWAQVFLTSRAGTIYAGTSEVQRTIIGERILELPKEPR